MGHKVHPTGFRLGVIGDWQAKWYADKHYSEFLHEDLKLRQAIQSWNTEAGISLVEIDRQLNKVSITIHTARPGVVIGRGGQRVDELRLHLDDLIKKRVQLNIQEIRQPELDAYLVAKSIAEQLERRVAYRRAMKQAVLRTIQAGAKGVRISCAGRLGGAEIARRQTVHQGQVPLHTLRADIDYGFLEARTTLGRIGVKVWIYKGDILPEPKAVEVEETPPEIAADGSPEAEPTVELEKKLTKRSKKAMPSTPIEPEEKPAEPTTAETEKTLSGAEPRKKLTTRSKKAMPSTPIEPEEKPAEPTTAETEKTLIGAEPKKKLTTTRSKKAMPSTPIEPEEKPAEPTAVETEKTLTEVKPEKKLTKRSKKAVPSAPIEPEEKPAEPTAVETEKTLIGAEPEKKLTKRSKKVVPSAPIEPEEKLTEPKADINPDVEPFTSMEKEEKDVTTQTGEISQDS